MQHTTVFFESVLRDLRYAFRSLRQSPTYAIAAIVTLGLGIGANTAIFSLVNGVLLQPLPYREGGDLVVLQHSAPQAGLDNLLFAVKEVYDYRDLNRTLDGVVEHHSMTFTLLGRDEPERVSTGVVSADFFDLLGVRPLLGRAFRPGDDALGAEAVLVLAFEYWQRSFGGDPGIVGRTFEMNNRPHTVVGVLPPIPQYPQTHDVYMPTSACPFRANGERAMVQNRGAFRAMTCLGRLREGVTLDQARADFSTIAATFRNEFPDTYAADSGYRITASPLQDELTRNARLRLLILLATTGLVLLIACANVANLALARMMRREREIAIRAALGASRGQLIQQLLVETTLLALVGAAFGLVLAFAGLDLLVAFVGRFSPRAGGISIDGWVLLFTFAVALATGLVAGTLPIAASRLRILTALREGGQSTASRGRQRLRGALVAAQVGLSVMLLIGAGLMIRSLVRLQQVDPGFATENVLSARLQRNWSKYNTAQDSQRFLTDVLARVRGLPGVISAASANTRPLGGQPPFTTALQIEGQAPPEGSLQPQIEPRVASTDYFRTMGIPLLRGRTFDDLDDASAPGVAVINQSLARRYWPTEDPLERRLSLDGGQTWITVMGVVGDVHDQSLDVRPVAAIYRPLAQSFWTTQLFVRTQMDPAAAVGPIKDVVHTLDAQQPIDDFVTLAETRRASMAGPRLTTNLLGLFAGLALAIMMAGIGGMIAYSVSQRTREIGIRMALGARPARMLAQVLRREGTLVAAGLGAGLVAALVSTRVLSGFLFDTSPRDPLTLIAVAVIVIATGVLAALGPARRAIRINPGSVLRGD